jgi:hypothetical protein
MSILTCEDHPHLRWYCKELSTSLDSNGVGRYNGMRNIFFFGVEVPGPLEYSVIDDQGVYQDECKCPASRLMVIKNE